MVDLANAVVSTTKALSASCISMPLFPGAALSIYAGQPQDQQQYAKNTHHYDIDFPLMLGQPTPHRFHGGITILQKP
jgi:hypothetical protein